GLQIRRSAAGSLWSPLVIDWGVPRQRITASWRPLTVAQNGVAIPSHQAAAYRLQIGAQQWMLFRGLVRAQEPRSVLGQHSMYETMIGRFLPGGKFDSILLVEQSSETR